MQEHVVPATMLGDTGNAFNDVQKHVVPATMLGDTGTASHDEGIKPNGANSKCVEPNWLR